MSRPTMDIISMTDTDWLTKTNSNFTKLFDVPFPVYQLPGTSPGFGVTPALFSNCIAIKDASIRISDGTQWSDLVPQSFEFVEALEVSASLSDVVDAFNLLLSKLTENGWMQS